MTSRRRRRLQPRNHGLRRGGLSAVRQRIKLSRRSVSHLAAVGERYDVKLEAMRSYDLGGGRGRRHNWVRWSPWHSFPVGGLSFHGRRSSHQQAVASIRDQHLEKHEHGGPWRRRNTSRRIGSPQGCRAAGVVKERR